MPRYSEGSLQLAQRTVERHSGRDELQELHDTGASLVTTGLGLKTVFAG
ncbi:hypothetical protein [Roseovarius sp.]